MYRFAASVALALTSTSLLWADEPPLPLRVGPAVGGNATEEIGAPETTTPTVPLSPNLGTPGPMPGASIPATSPSPLPGTPMPPPGATAPGVPSPLAPAPGPVVAPRTYPAPGMSVPPGVVPVPPSQGSYSLTPHIPGSVYGTGTMFSYPAPGVAIPGSSASFTYGTPPHYGYAPYGAPYGAFPGVGLGYAAMGYGPFGGGFYTGAYAAGLHLRYPYYSYRHPWFYPGPASQNVTIYW